MKSNPSDPRIAELDDLTAKMRASLDPKSPPQPKPDRLTEVPEDEPLAKLIEKNRMSAVIVLTFCIVAFLICIVMQTERVPSPLIGVMVACGIGGSAFSAIKMLLKRVRKLEARINSLEAALQK